MATSKAQSQSFRLSAKPRAAPATSVEWGEIAALARQLAAEFPVLALYLGDSRIHTAAQDFSSTLKADIGFDEAAPEFPRFLAQSKRYSLSPEIAELAALEFSFQPKFDTRKASRSISEIAVAMDCAQLGLHPSVKVLVFHQNTTSLWSAIKCGEAPPRPYQLDAPQHVLVWHRNFQPRFRILGEDEALSLASFAKRTSNKSPYFRGWVEAGLVVAPLK